MKKKKVIKISPPENNFVIHYDIIDITLSFPDHKWLCRIDVTAVSKITRCF